MSASPGSLQMSPSPALRGRVDAYSRPGGGAGGSPTHIRYTNPAPTRLPAPLTVAVRFPAMPRYLPAFEDFEQLARRGNTIPVYCQLLADHLTPVTAFAALAADAQHAFL